MPLWARPARELRVCAALWGWPRRRRPHPNHEAVADEFEPPEPEAGGIIVAGGCGVLPVWLEEALQPLSRCVGRFWWGHINAIV